MRRFAVHFAFRTLEFLFFELASINRAPRWQAQLPPGNQANVLIRACAKRKKMVNAASFILSRGRI